MSGEIEVARKAAPECRGCGQKGLLPLFSLGAMPPVNAFVERGGDQPPAAPLDLALCPACSLVQLEQVVAPSRLFSSYAYVSSASKAYVGHLSSVAEFVSREFGLTDTSKVFEIGSNDGTLLGLLKRRRMSVLGVDPAANLAPLAREIGVETEVAFFDAAVAESVAARRGLFDAVIALNVVAHTPNFVSMLEGVRRLLAPGGAFLMENAYVLETILKGQFDTIYHEHVFCFSLQALVNAYRKAGLVAVDAEIIPTQGTSIRVVVKRADERPVVQASVGRILDSERRTGLTRPEAFEEAARKTVEFRRRCREWIAAQKAAGRAVVGLGAPARGVVIANYCGLRADDVECVVDDTALKTGRLMPGTGIPVVGWEALEDRRQPTAYLLFSWNYEEDFLRRARERGARGRILVPFPELRESML